jgi:hypothetical protein
MGEDAHINLNCEKICYRVSKGIGNFKKYKKIYQKVDKTLSSLCLRVLNALWSSYQRVFENLWNHSQ